MSYNISSSSIHVFPAVNRDADYVKESRVFTEQLLTNLVNNLLDSKAFVVDYTVSDLDGQPASLSFNIDGYFFKIDSGLADFLSNFSTQFCATLSKTANLDFPYDTLNQDDNGNYSGVSFDESGTLILLRKNEENNKWEVPQESQMKYDSRKLLGIVEHIDGGEIT